MNRNQLPTVLLKALRSLELRGFFNFGAILMAGVVLCTSGCKTTAYYVEETNRSWNQAADGSSSPVSEKDAVNIAKVIVTKREHWPENMRDSSNLIHIVCYRARRVNDGGWVVIAQRGVMEGRPESCGGCGYDGTPAAIVFINKKGDVTRYSRQYVINN